MYDWCIYTKIEFLQSTKVQETPTKDYTFEMLESVWIKFSNCESKELKTLREKKVSREENFANFAVFGPNPEIRFLFWRNRMSDRKNQFLRNFFKLVIAKISYRDIVFKKYWVFCLTQCLLNYIFLRPSVISVICVNKK